VVHEVERQPVDGIELVVVAAVAALVALFFILDGPGIGGHGDDLPPVEQIVVERTQLHRDEIELTLRNEGRDDVRIAQVNVGDYYAPFTQSRESIGRLQKGVVTIAYPWIEGEPLELKLITSAGGGITTAIDAAAESPPRDTGFFALMALLGLYVGVIPIALGMLWMPFVRASSAAWTRGLLAFTVGLLAFLAIDATVEGLDTGAASAAFEGGALVFAGALVAYVVLEGVEGYLSKRSGGSLSAAWLSLLIAIGIGLHNLGEGLAIGSAYAVGALALGSFLVVGFAIHNTTEGLAIVTPLAGGRPSLTRLAALGAIAGGPAILGAVVGSTAYQPALAALLLGVGAGAVAQVAIKLLPLLRDSAGRTLTPLTASSLVGGIGFLYGTSLLVG
jgi:hypothetical protein